MATTESRPVIAVTGATGTTGSELVRRLSERGSSVRALSRHPEEAPRHPGVEWVTADLRNRQDLVAAFAGAEKLFLLTGNSGGMVQLQKNAIRAAEEAGLSHVVKLSALGASDHSKSVIGVWHHNVETALKASGLRWTLLRPHYFMQNLLDEVESIRNEGRVYSPSGEGQIPMIDARDIAASAAVVLTEPGHEGKTYTLTGPESLSFRQATAILAEVTGKDLTYVPETDDEAWQRLRRAAQPPWLIAGQLALAEYHRRGGATAIVTDTVEELTGCAPRTFKDFARDYAEAF